MLLLLSFIFTLYSLLLLYRNFSYDCDYNLHIRISAISGINLKKRLVYIVNPTAGLANTLRGMASTIFVSYIYRSSFSLKGWKSIIYYFKFPKMLICNDNFNNTFIYKKFDISLLNILQCKVYVIQITDIHGFLDSILYDHRNSRSLQLIKKIYSIKGINKRIINNIIYSEFFIPSNIIKVHLNKFYLKKKKMKVLGIHIRSGEFYNNYTENYFSRDIKLNAYMEKANQIIKKYNIVYVFAISDNERYIIKLKNHYRRLILDIQFKGNIVHSRFSLYKSEVNDNAIRIVSEFIILSNCDFIIGTRRSSFSSESCNVKMKKCILI